MRDPGHTSPNFVPGSPRLLTLGHSNDITARGYAPLVDVAPVCVTQVSLLSLR